MCNIKGGQGRTHDELTDAITTPLWLALTLIQLGAVIGGLVLVYDTGGLLLAAVVALCCVVAWTSGFRWGGAS